MDSNTENQAKETAIDESNTDSNYVLKRGRKPSNNQHIAAIAQDLSPVEVNSVCNDAISAKIEKIPAIQDSNTQKTTEIVDDGLDSQFASKDADDVQITPSNASRNKQRPARTNDERRNDNRRDDRRDDNRKDKPNAKRENNDRSCSKPRDFNGKKEQAVEESSCCCLSSCSLCRKIRNFFARLFGKKQAPKQEQKRFDNNRPRNNNNNRNRYSSYNRQERRSDNSGRQSDRRNNSNNN